MTWFIYDVYWSDIGDFVQDSSYSIANTLELL